MTMTPQLRGDTSLVRGAKVFKKVWYLRSLWDSTLWTKAERDNFYAKAALASTTAVFCPKEKVPSVDLSIVTRGLVAKNGHLGIDVLAEDVVLRFSGILGLPEISADVLLDTTPGMALTLVQVTCLATSDFEQLLIEYPGAAQVVRTATIKIRLQHLFRRTAAVAREQDKSGRKTDLYSAITEVRRQLGANPQGFEMKRGVEARVDEMGHKLDRLTTTVQRLVDTVATSPDRPSSPRPKKSKSNGGRPLPRKDKSVPPPLPRGADADAVSVVVQSNSFPPPPPPRPRPANSNGHGASVPPPPPQRPANPNGIVATPPPPPPPPNRRPSASTEHRDAKLDA